MNWLWIIAALGLSTAPKLEAPYCFKCNIPMTTAQVQKDVGVPDLGGMQRISTVNYTCTNCGAELHLDRTNWVPAAKAIRAAIQPELPPTPITIASTNPATFELRYLSFDPVPGAEGYWIHVIPIARGRFIVEPYGTNDLSLSHSAINTETNWVVGSNATVVAIPHLIYDQTYWLQIATLKYWTNQTTHESGTNGGLSQPLAWPQQRTNFNVGSMQLSPDMNVWTNIPGTTVVITNPPTVDFLRVAGFATNNIDAYQKRE